MFVITVLLIHHILQLLLFFVETKQVTLKIMCRIQKVNEKSKKTVTRKIFKRKTYYYTEFTRRRRKEFQDK